MDGTGYFQTVLYGRPLKYSNPRKDGEVSRIVSMVFASYFQISGFPIVLGVAVVDYKV